MSNANGSVYVNQVCNSAAVIARYTKISKHCVCLCIENEVIMLETVKFVLAASAVATLAACGGGGGGSTAAPVVTATQSAAGVWQASIVVTSGVNTGNTIKSYAMVSPSGTFYSLGVNQNNGCAGVGFGQSSVTGSTISGTQLGAVVTFSSVPGVNVSCTYADGTTKATGSFTGTVATASNLVVTSTGTTSGGLALGNSTTNYTWSALNNLSPSLATVAGNYTSSANGGFLLTVSSNGTVSSTDSVTGCRTNGNFTIPSTTNNIYNVSVVYSGCSASYSALNGVTVTGLATYDNTVTPNQLITAYNATVSNQTIIVAEAFHR